MSVATDPGHPAPPCATDPQLRPWYAPLSVPVWEHLLMLRAPRLVTAAPLGGAARQALQALQAAQVQDLLAAIAADRVQVDAWLPPVLTPGAAVRVLAALGLGDPRRLRARLTTWRRAGLLRPAQPRAPLDRALVSALLIAWLERGSRARGWLPARLPPDEPAWWCWCQPAPDAPRQPCPVPLPATLPAGAWLWTPWAGAAHLPGWQPLGGGAARWATPPPLGALRAWAAATGVALDAATDPAQTVLQALAAWMR